MGKSIAVIVFTAAFFCAVMVGLAARHSRAARITGAATLLAALGGFFIYGSGFAHQTDLLPLAVTRAVMASLGMFLGRSEPSAVSGVAFFESPRGQLFFWFAHFLALYATASAALTTIGAGMLRRLRLLLATRGDLTVIFGVNADSVAFGERLAAGEESHTPIIFADSQPDSGLAGNIAAIGGVLLGGQGADRPTVRLLRGLGMRPGRRRLTVYAMEKDPARNLRYAQALLLALRDRGIRPRQTGLVLLGGEDTGASRLLAVGEEYGYGSVALFEEPELAARLLIRRFPPWEALTFDEAGRAREDFEALIVGFGRVGQAVLKSLVMNGQFEGSRFALTVFAPDCREVSGGLDSLCHALTEKYDITLCPRDARSGEMYRFLREHRQRLRYVVLCTGDQKLDLEIAGELTRYLARIGCGAAVYQCSRKGVRRQGGPGLPPEEYPVYAPEVLCTGRMDRMAMGLNHRYCAGSGLSPQENWDRCDYFSRLSSRASADFIPAMLRAAGRTPEKALADWDLSPALLENLSRTEHLRWCAFHCAMGFDTMDPETFAARCARYRREVEQSGESRLRVGKDMDRRLHACLIPWEELDRLSAAENAATGGQVDYKELDRRNVLAIPEVLRAGMGGDGAGELLPLPSPETLRTGEE